MFSVSDDLEDNILDTEINMFVLYCHADIRPQDFIVKLDALNSDYYYKYNNSSGSSNNNNKKKKKKK